MDPAFVGQIMLRCLYKATVVFGVFLLGGRMYGIVCKIIEARLALQASWWVNNFNTSNETTNLSAADKCSGLFSKHLAWRKLATFLDYRSVLPCFFRCLTSNLLPLEIRVEEIDGSLQIQQLIWVKYNFFVVTKCLIWKIRITWWFGNYEKSNIMTWNNVIDTKKCRWKWIFM